MARITQPPTGLDALLRRIETLERNAVREASRQRPATLPVLSGAGKVTVTDADFEEPAYDGAAAIVVNTTDNTRRIAVRQANAWLVTAALS